MPRQYLCFRMLVLSAMLAMPASAQQVGIQWQTDIETAKALARQTNRLVLIHFWTPSCGPCMMLNQNVFSQAGVASTLEARFVPVKLNADENSATAMGFGITRVPTDVIITPDGQMVGKLISPPTPAAYIAEITQLANEYTTRQGQAFAHAAAAAPTQSQLPRSLNTAYANLPIGPTTPPVIASAATPSASDRYGSVPLTGAPVAGNSVATWPSASVPAQLLTTPATEFQSHTAPQSAAPIAQSQPPAQPIQPSQPQMQTNRYASYTPGDVAAASAVPFAAPPLATASVASSNTQPPFAQATAEPAVVNNQFTTAPTAPGPSFAATTASESSATPPVGSPDVRRLPPGAPPLGFDGYCPVSMRTQWKWLPGDPRWGIVHRGRTYWFAGQQEQQQFWSNPDHYSPALSGMDPVLAIDHKQQVPGRREHSLDYDNLFYLFASEATLQQFAANPERYAASVRQAMGIERGRFVR